MRDMGTKEDLLNLLSRYSPPGSSNLTISGTKPPAQEIEEIIRNLNAEEAITRELTKKNL